MIWKCHGMIFFELLLTNFVCPLEIRDIFDIKPYYNLIICGALSLNLTSFDEVTVNSKHVLFLHYFSC